MQETPHYGLKKPEESDYLGPERFNENADIIDAALHGLEEGKADLDPVTHKVNPDQLPTMNYEAPLKDASAKAYPVDNDGIVLVDNADSKTKRVLWSSIKTTLKTWLDTLYSAVGHTHTPGNIGAAPASHVDDAVKHITAAERTAWTGKAAGSHTHAPTDLTVAVPITKGGTGATTAAAARAALAALGAFAPTAITISATWSGTGPWTQSIAVAGVLAAWDWRLGLHLAKITDDAARKLQEKAFACITWCETYDGGITLTCRDKKPDVAISAVLAGEV